jgi:hypothetical protein
MSPAAGDEVALHIAVPGTLHSAPMVAAATPTRIEWEVDAIAYDSRQEEFA